MAVAMYDLYREAVYILSSQLEPPVLTFNPRRGRWRLEHPYVYDDHGFRIIIQQGFEFDLASVPRTVWAVIAPFELSIVAPLIHDYLYVYGGNLPPGGVTPYQTYTRRAADLLFLEIMRREGIVEWRCRTAYNAVRLFGSIPWRGSTVPEDERSIVLMEV